MLLDSISEVQATTLQDIPIASLFKYLGVYVTPRPIDYLSLNSSPLLGRIRVKMKIWVKLRLSLVGKVNLVKMIFMPQSLYILHNSPMVDPLKQFCIINSIFHTFLWQARPPRIRLEQLQKPKDKGGGGDLVDSVMALLHYVTGVDNVAEGLEGLIFAKSNKLFPTSLCKSSGIRHVSCKKYVVLLDIQ